MCIRDSLLKWSHEAWEESIEIYGIPSQDIFPDFSIRKSQIIFPIVNCEANFLAPIKIGDFLKIKISPHKINTPISPLPDSNLVYNSPLGILKVGATFLATY